MKKFIFAGLCAAASIGLAALPAVASGAQTSWAPQTLRGTISMVDPSQHVVVVKDASGIPYDIVVHHSTLIESGNQKLSLNSLSSDLNKQVTVHYVPRANGDVASMVRISG